MNEEISYKNRDEMLFEATVKEACERCETLAARFVYVIKKLKRVEQARIAKAKEPSSSSKFKKEDGTVIDVSPTDLSLLEKHQAEHYFLALPFYYQIQLVDAECAFHDKNYQTLVQLPLTFNVDLTDEIK